MEKEMDEYCEKIFMVLTIVGEKIRFNELHRKLTKYGPKMSKPTLIEHLNHLVENGIIQRDQEDKQRVSYGLNWKKLKQLQKAKKINEAVLNLIKDEERFKSKGLDQQTSFIIAMLIMSELFRLKVLMLDILEPENKLQNTFSYAFIRRVHVIYVSWLFDSCKDSKENTQKVICSIDKEINALTKIVFKIFQEATQ